MLDPRQLRAFLALAQSGSFTLAGRQLHLTQSAISHAMRALEDELGCPLLYRSGKKIRLTPAGHRLRNHAEGILERLRRAEEDLSSLEHVDRGELRVAFSYSTAQHLLPGIIREFHDCFPLCQIRVQVGDTSTAVTALEQGTVDLAIMVGGILGPNLKSTPIFDDQVLFMVAPSHPWARRSRVEPADVHREPCILTSRTSSTYRLIEQYLLRAGARLGPVIEVASSEVIKELVKLGLGVGLLAPWTARKELAEGSLVAISPGTRPLKRRWVVAYEANRPLRMLEQSFLGLCREVSVIETREVVPRQAPAGAAAAPSTGAGTGTGEPAEAPIGESVVVMD
ncbi:LysR family transcriptional regulator [Verrucomicrobia bacterium LW23]|nr:LysR family transcriptional regulator [Verrucomicrobia bacterium LW23]